MGSLRFIFFFLTIFHLIASEEFHEGLPFCGLKSITDKYIFISTLDGKLTTVNAEDGSFVWEVQAGNEPMLSSSIHRLELTSYGQLVRMIPSLSGGLYKFNGENIEPVPVSVDHLLQSSFKYSDDLVMSGGKESHSFGVSIINGEILYECSMKSCGNHSEAAAAGSDVIVIQRQSQIVRAIEPRSGVERWNFSVAQHDVKLFSECHSLNEEENLFHFKVIVPEGLIYAVDKETKEVIWQYQFDSPIVSAWQMLNGKLVDVDLFSGSTFNNENNNALVSPSIYVGMHNKQLYIQESVTLQNKRQELAARYRYNLLSGDEANFPAIPWHPIPASQAASGLLTDESGKLKQDSAGVQTTAISVLYASAYVNGNGFYLYTEEESFRNSTCSTAGQVEEEKSEDVENTPVQIVIVSLWYWWREVLVISLTTAIVFNVMFIRRFVSKMTKKEQERRSSSSNSNVNTTTDTTDVLTLPLTRSRNVSESQSALPVFTSRYLNDFEPVQCLGKGGFGVVFEAKNKIDECKYAIKRIVLPNKKTSRERVMREVKALAKLDHHHIVRYFNAWLEYPPPGWQENHDRYWINSDCSGQETITTTGPAKSTFHRSNLIPLNLTSKTDGSAVCLNIETPTREQYDSKLFNVRESIGDSFIEFASESKDKQQSFVFVKKVEEVEKPVVSGDQGEGDVIRDPSTSSRIYLYIQMQLCQRRSLREWLQENSNRNYKQVLQIFEQIVQAVEYVHMRELIHRDLKPSNIFFSPEGQIKVGDFGLVTSIHSDEEHQTNSSHDRAADCETTKEIEKHTAKVGTQFYMSPEQLMDKPYNYKVDIYSLGLIFFELLVPFGTQMERSRVLSCVRKSQFPDCFKEKFHDEYELLKLMLSHDPDHRPTTIGIRSREPLRQLSGDVEQAVDNSKWHFELPPRARGASLSGSSTDSFENLG